MKIIVVHKGEDYELFPLMSLLIGLTKKYPKCSITWAGFPETANLTKYNKRVAHFLDASQEITLQNLRYTFGSDICVNISTNKEARKFASSLGSEKIIGFDKNGATSPGAEFFEKVTTCQIKTNKTLLQLYYDLAGLQWRGEGYGLSYYPRTKQINQCGQFLEDPIDECTKIHLPKQLTKCLDLINQFAEIHTDDLFVLYSGIALRKKVHFLSDVLPYRIEFFGNGNIKPKG